MCCQIEESISNTKGQNNTEHKVLNKAGFFFVQIDRGNKQKLAFGIVINIPSTIVFPRKCDS